MTLCALSGSLVGMSSVRFTLGPFRGAHAQRTLRFPGERARPREETACNNLEFQSDCCLISCALARRQAVGCFMLLPWAPLEAREWRRKSKGHLHLSQTKRTARGLEIREKQRDNQTHRKRSPEVPQIPKRLISYPSGSVSMAEATRVKIS